MSKFAIATATAAAVSQVVSADDWHMQTVTVYQGRASGDAPVWKGDHYESKYGYESGLDTVNTASIESTLYYVQVEGTRPQQQPLPADDCERKNNMSYITFYEMEISQPNAGLAEFAGNASSPIGYCPYATMDAGHVHNDQWSGLITYENNKTIFADSCVGAQEQPNAARGPYKNNIWYSFPNSCPQGSWLDDQPGYPKKTEECRKQYPGGLCPEGVSPKDGNCVFSYKILGYISIDELTGITAMGYNSFKDFCMDKTNASSNWGIELSIVQDGSGFTTNSSIPFWANSTDLDANMNRTHTMMEMYNKAVEESDGKMIKLPEPEDIQNPPCYQNQKECADAQYGCKRVSWGQMCEVCNQAGDGCEAAPADFSYPVLQKPVTPTPTTADPSGPTKSPDSGGSGSSGKNGASTILVGTAAIVVAALLNTMA